MKTYLITADILIYATDESDARAQLDDVLACEQSPEHNPVHEWTHAYTQEVAPEPDDGP